MDLARNWRLTGARYRLEGSHCLHCEVIHFPARKVCRACRSRNLAPVQLSGRGEVYSYTTLHQAPEGFPIPYVVALVQLDEGLLVTTQLTDVQPEEVHIGMPVEMVTRKLSQQGDNGLIVYGYQFRPPLPVFVQEESLSPVSFSGVPESALYRTGLSNPSAAAISDGAGIGERRRGHNAGWKLRRACTDI